MTTAMLVPALKRITASFAVVAISAVAAAMACITLPAASTRRSEPPGPAQPAEPPKPNPGPTATLQVIAQDDGSPLAGATVFVRGRGGRTATWEGVTDDQGRYTIIPPSEATGWFDIVVAPVGYEVGYVSTVGTPAPIVVKLKRAEAIGGIVRDERGRPIAGARVFPMVYAFAEIWPEIEASPNSGWAIAMTDAQGRWRSESLPVGTRPDARIRVQVTRPGHIAIVSHTTAREARDAASVQVMRPGVSISGTVLSPFGRPVAGATVTIATPPRDGTILRLATDRDGRFRSSRCLDPDSAGLVLVVQAPGLAWSVHHVAATAEIPPQVIRLNGRRPLEGRVADAQGRPVAGALVTTSRDVFRGLLGWETQTDANGRFVWYDAPTTGKVYLDVSTPTFPWSSRTIARPEAGEVTIILRRD